MSRKKWSTRKKWLLIPLLSVGVAALLLFVVTGIHAIYAASAMKAITAELTEKNIPITWVELLAQMPQNDPDHEGQKELFAALNAISEVPSVSDEDNKLLPIEGQADLPAVGEPLPDTMIDALERRIEQTSAPMIALRKAVDKKPFWFTAPTNASDMITFMHIAHTRHAARLNTMEAILETARGNPEKAVQRVIDGVKLADSLETDPLLIGGLVRVACDAIPFDALERVLAQTDPSAEKLLDLQALLTSEGPFMRTAVLGELSYMRQIYQSITRDSLNSLLQFEDASFLVRLLPLFLHSDGWLRINEVAQMKLLSGIWESWPLGHDEFNKEHEKLIDDIPRYCVLTKMTADMYSLVHIGELSMQGKRRCARLGIALELYSRKKGHYPETLQKLVPDFIQSVPLDPFTEKPISYENTDTTRVFFSVPNRKKRNYEFTLK
jgi:hypothetical protein